ncbi:MAG TPA: hypothetical protein DIU35_03465 [Candidatus Latescibacteria bacterium]|nr:hypothetical protein [Candidatus Latescibacterota bacterium]
MMSHSSSEVSEPSVDRPMRSSDEAVGVSFRAVILGMVLVVILDIWVIYAEYILRSSRLNVSHHFPVSVFALLVLVVCLSNLWSRMGRRGLSSAELITVLTMCLVGIVIPSNGLTSYLMGALSAPYYFATPENSWGSFHPFLKPWLAPDDLRAMRWFYEGLPDGMAVPWQAWASPLAWWGLLGAAFVLVSASVAAIFRKQWAQNERLIYPILSPALELTRTDDEPGWLPGFMRSPLFWVGFAISFCTLAWNIMNYFEPLIPRIPILGSWFSLARGFPYTFHTRINFFTVGFAYFANIGVLFSVWFFFTLSNLEMLIVDRVGYTIPLGGGASLPSESNPMVTFQTTGAFLAFVFWAMWSSRHHLKEVLQNAIGKGDSVYDHGEALSYRVSSIGVVFGSLFIILWLYAAGMQMGVSTVLLLSLMVGYLGVAKMVAEIGLLYTPSTLVAEGFVVATMGTANMTPGSVTVLAFSQNMVCYNKGMVMPPLVHVTRLSDYLERGRGMLLLAAFGALVVSYLVSVVYTLWLGYGEGAFNFNAYPLSYYSRRIFDRVVYRLGNPWQIDPHRLMFLMIGFFTMAAMTVLRYRVQWWRLNPIGFALPRLPWQVFSLFVAWVCKALILRLGGVTLYRQSQPFFVGLLVGYALAVALSSGVDWIWFAGQGHSIHSW